MVDINDDNLNKEENLNHVENLNNEDNKDLENNDLDNNENDSIEDNLDANVKDYTEEEKKPEETKEDSLEDKLNQSEDKYKRLLAEFDNYRKRTEKEKLAFIDIGATSVLTKILPVVDNLERALANVKDDMKSDPFVEGIEKTYKQLEKVFEELKIKSIKTVGEKFDANLHNAVMMEEEGDAEPETITEELQKGWMYGEQVLRHAMVKVKK